jgi:hypothetical protein
MNSYLDQATLLSHLWTLPVPIEEEIKNQEKLLSYTKQSVRRKKVHQRLNYLYKLKREKDLQNKVMDNLMSLITEKMGISPSLFGDSIYGNLFG